jgi:hypothetical protein
MVGSSCSLSCTTNSGRAGGSSSVLSNALPPVAPRGRFFDDKHAHIRFERRQADARDHLIAHALDRHDVRGAFAHERHDIGVKAADDLRARFALAAAVAALGLAIERTRERDRRIDERRTDGT